MGYLRRLLRPQANMESLPGPLDDWWYKPLGGYTDAGIPIDAATAEKISAVYRCVSIIAGSVANLPFPVYRRLGEEGKQRERTHPVYRLLNERPNRWQTAYEWRRQMQRHVLMRGNGYSRKVTRMDGSMELWPLHPDVVRPEQRADGSIVYHVPREVQAQGVLLQDEMFHLRGPSDDGVCGLGVLDVAREAFGSALVQQRFANRFFKQAPSPGAALEHPGSLTDQAHKNLKRSITEDTAGEGAHSLLILEEGMKFASMPVGLTAEQAQLVASREFTKQDIATFFGVPNHLIGETTKETSWGSGIEQMSAGFVIYTLRDWLTLWEQAVSRDLILATQVFFAEVLVDGLLRGDSKTRADVYAIATGGAPYLTVNEVREMENRNPLPGGDALAAPAPAPAPAANPSPTDSATNAAEMERLQVLVRSNGHGNG